MGNASSSEGEAEIPFIKDSEKSARNVLEKIGKVIKDKASEDARKYSNVLKGNLKSAKFHHEFSKYSDVPHNPCGLDFAYHSNTSGGFRKYRHPCYGRQAKLNSKLEGSVCTNSKIEGNEKKINGAGACAPYRRRHICDLNLEYIDVHNVQNIHDLLGNILVTAKYEGESIVDSYGKSGTLNVCTALARSFADIGDIVRGKDLFLGNNDNDKIKKEKLQNNLKRIFVNIYKNMNMKEISQYKDDDIDGNYCKLREYWWNANRDQIWKAITCAARGNDLYSKNIGNGTTTVSNAKCREGDENPSTNLDYVPQFLRWFEEWAEEFCRKRKDKLKKVKEACRGEDNKKYCSHNGCDCEKTIGKIRHFVWDDKCNKCSIECGLYQNWMKDQKLEFEKQKEKYESEINGYTSAQGDSNKKIYKGYNDKFYKDLEGEHGKNKSFLNLLNEGKYCKGGLEGEKDIDFTKTGDKGIFYRSDYCQVCPDCGVDCSSGTCKKKEETDDNCGKPTIYTIPTDVKPTDINVLYSGDGHGDIVKRLNEFCTGSNKENGKNNETWQCYYKNGDDNKCQMTSLTQTDEKHRYVMTFHKFFNFWVRNLLIDTINWETDLRNCLNNTGITDCDNECNKNCKCFQSWVDKKEIEWKNVNKVFENENISSHDYYNKLNGLFEGYFFEVMDKLNQDETKWNKLKENLKKKIDFSKGKADGKNSEGAIELLLEYLKENATICKDNNTNEGCDPSVDSKTNPCGKNTKAGSDKVISVKQIAQYYKRIAHKQLNERGSRSALKGDASKGTYRRQGKPSNLKEICEITLQHSNDSRLLVLRRHLLRRRRGDYNGPCAGKDGQRTMFQLLKGWENGRKVTEKHLYDVFLPPRREHFCTSNLENLNTDARGLKNSSLASHSLLGDVLLAAKEQANFIKNKYKRQKASNGFKDKETICRAVRYSFADIGDIIRGKDLWDHKDQKTKLQGHLKNVFAKIKDHSVIKGKYTKCNSPYLELRSDWWEANRDQIWKVMTCPIKNGITCGSSDHTPLDDYIPQKLRWLTEWAEWYCKVQKKEYEKLKKDCQECKEKDAGCWKGESVCEKCKPACEQYKTKIQPWEKQWKTVSAIYQILYKEAEIYARNGGPGYYKFDVQEEDKPVVDFLYNLYLQNGGKKGPPPDTHMPRIKEPGLVDTTPTVYSTAEGYIHQEAHIGDCKEQHVFCDNNGNKEKYAFKNPPNVYDEACKCMTREAPPPPTTPSTPNPCVTVGDDKSGSSGKIKSVTEVAGDIQRETLERVTNVTGLTADASKGTYSRTGRASDFNNNLCGITQIHSNAHNDSQEPCNGKNQKRFNVGTEWSYKDNKNKKTHPEAYMPPRREHMCTSNLEYLIHKGKQPIIQGDPNKIIHSLLGDVLLAAKYEAKKIKELYEKNKGTRGLNDENDNATICRAVRYSFADIGDIIKGTDLWDQNKGEQKTQRNLEQIFEKIKVELKDKLNGKYNDDKHDNKYINLRSDWWEANRDKVWEAMKCQTTPSDTFPCSGTDSGIPFDDYIPQRLRWMTEWAEWYCKMQKEEYDKLVTGCGGCRSKGGKCEKECGQCKEKCKEYEQKIKKWEEQWTKIKEKYEELYKKAQNSDTSNSGTTYPKDEKDVVSFLSKLHKKNKDSNKIYETAEGYVHQELPNMGCKEQTRFCKNPNGETSPSGKENHKEYAFREKPYDHDDKCDCTDKTAPPPTKPEVPPPTKPEVPPPKKPEAPPSGPPPERDVRHDYRGRSEGGENRAAGPRSPPAPAGNRGVGRSATSHDVPPAGPQPPKSKPKPNRESVARYLPPRGPTDHDVDEDEEDEEEDDSEEEEETKPVKEGTDGQKDTGSSTEDTKQGDLPSPTPAPTTPTVEDICKIVGDALKGDLNDACRQKYGGNNSRLGWKCIPSGNNTTTGPAGRSKRDTSDDPTTGKSGSGNDKATGGELHTRQRRSADSGKPTSDKGAICVPPRRRRLYIQKLHDWASGTTQAGGDKATEALRDAFIKCAAVETFFLWDRYKKEWLAQKKAEQERENGEPVIDTSTLGKELQDKLESGKIPNDFLRQMFYTLGDYRDLCVGNTPNGIDTNDKETMEKIQEKIKSIIEKSGDTPPPTPGTQPSVEKTTPESWWEKHGKDIWEGMICALTYKDSDEKGTDSKPPTQIDEVQKAFFGTQNGNPGTPGTTGTSNGTFHKKYHYDSVRLKEDESGDGPKITGGDDPINNPKLKDFVEIPTYFRWLHEWGSDFCGTRKRMLKNVKKACRETPIGNPTFCSGDGHDCTDENLKHKNIFAGLDCPRCYEQCRKYRKWIDIKFAEFHNQRDKYDGERQKVIACSKNGGGDNNCCTEIKKKNSAAEFLESLNHCKNSEGDGSDPDNKINFNDPKTTFGPLDYCKTCPPNKVSCNVIRGRSGGTNPCKPVNGKSWENVFNGNGENSTANITVEMIDRRGPHIEKKSDNSFIKSSLFKGLRVQNWKCKFNDQKMNVCKLTNFDGNIDLNDYTTFKVFLVYWLEDFIEGYYILKKRKIIDKCTENGEKACSEEFKKHCACVKAWITKKKEEWGKIKHHFKDREQKDGDTVVSKVRNFLETLIPRIAPKKNNGEVTELSDLERSLGCNCAENSKQKEVEDDALGCLLNKLTEKIKTATCPNQTSSETLDQSGVNSAQCEKSTHVEDDDPLEEENPVTQPNICPPTPKVDKTTPIQTQRMKIKMNLFQNPYHIQSHNQNDCHDNFHPPN
ncbi:hypothetical protein C923_00427 [Plasmodium falciparum UGT5.1]|uniref:Erythrocyte membrane protein 1 n=1 Tax=Plasmodium falciparum UGT5.1 TaxID=1237627 RepID=W7JVH7_PLAFA|nr:hypothetical protein C923_00427 [Plasmodium falciparum UGT5.1]